jgi:hypothetical protein
MSLPIYFVIYETKRMPMLNIPVYDIVKVIACDLDDIEEVYKKEVVPVLYTSNSQLQVMYFYREPDNPFRNSQEKEGKSTNE